MVAHRAIVAERAASRGGRRVSGWPRVLTPSLLDQADGTDPVTLTAVAAEAIDGSAFVHYRLP